MLLGRDSERGRLREVLARARAGRGVAMLVRGEPGIGKTALLEDVRSQADGFRVLSARGVESEADLPFSGLADLLRPVLNHVQALPEGRRVALQAALALGPPGVPDRFAAYAATFDLLSDLASDTPILMLVDDAHWLDRPTREALFFCVRRLSDDPIAVVTTMRETWANELDSGSAEGMRLGPLQEAASRAVLESHSGALAGAVVRELLNLAEGNPLALIELPRGLSEDERAGRVALPPAPPVTEALARSYRARIERLAAGPRRATLMVAVSEDGDLRALTAALAPAGGGPADLAVAEAAGLITRDADRAHMRHPVLRSVVLELAGADGRRSAHRALADALDPRYDGETHAWHKAEASIGPDEEAAAALDGAAMAAVGRTAYDAAASALERAASLSEDPAARAVRLTRAAGLAMAAGLPAWGISLVDEAGPHPAAAHLRGLLFMLTGDLEGAFETLVREGERVAATDPVAAAAMLADAVLTRTIAGDCFTALRIARRAYVVGSRAPEPVPTLSGYLAGALVLRGHAREARPLLERFDALTADIDPTSPGGQMVVLSASWRGWLGDWDVTSTRLGEWIATARTAGAVGFLGFVLAFACEVDFRMGDWVRARSRGEESIALLAETGQQGPAGYAMCALACAEAGLGLSGPARERARAARDQARLLGLASVEVYAGAALGFAALGDGNPAAAAEELAPLEAVAVRLGLGEPATVPWQPDLVEAYVRLGRLDAARRVLATLSEQAHRGRGVWGLAVTCRCRGLIDDDIDRHFGEALALHARTPLPFERARTELAYGARLRRLGRRTRGREQLRRALATFEEIGALPWAQQAREEIAASGGRLRPRREGRLTAELSPRELQVALTVAEGATNREAAARLFLSEKTVERHLGSVYGKLGIRSRTDLARVMASPTAGTVTPHAEPRPPRERSD